ncbi:hypothetical protein AGMMS50293_10940 [Spirochaetia bacterium]|nr:hypothetical protein AGMMS50293_10940 [Spirochaetia bacterium]
MPSARSSALGGNHVALADDFYSLFTNPAAFVGVKEEFSAAELTLNTYGPLFEIMDMILSNPSSLEDLDLSGIIDKRGFAAGMDLGGPLSLGWVGRSLGLGIFNRIKADATVSGFKLKPMVSGEVLLVGGYSYRILNKERHVLDAGFLGKGFYRMGLNLESSIFNAGEIFDDVGKTPLTTVLGLGFDLGVKYTFAENLSAALVCFDAYSPAVVSTFHSLDDFNDKEKPDESHYATVKPRLALGLKYRIRSTWLDKYISNFTVLADYQDFFDLASLIPRNPILNVGLGAELVVLEKLSLRFGINDALPALGFGLDLSFMQLDCAIYGRELGLDPGFQSTYAIDIGLLFRY